MARETAALSRHVSRTFPTLDNLFEAADRVRLLDEHPGLSDVRRLLWAEIDAINAQMEAAQTPLEQAEYAQKHGRIGGLRALDDAIETILAHSQRALIDQNTEDAAGNELVAER